MHQLSINTNIGNAIANDDHGFFIPGFRKNENLQNRSICSTSTQNQPPQHYAQSIAASATAYNGFNLIVGDLRQAYYLGNRDSLITARPLAPGRHVLSNHLLDTPWPKAERLRQALDRFPLDQLEQSLTTVFDILKDTTQAEDHALPDTGLPRERERLLSSPFIVSPNYGTRCSTVIAVHANGRSLLSEISYSPAGLATQRHDWPFMVENAAAPYL